MCLPQGSPSAFPARGAALQLFAAAAAAAAEQRRTGGTAVAADPDITVVPAAAAAAAAAAAGGSDPGGCRSHRGVNHDAAWPVILPKKPLQAASGGRATLAGGPFGIGALQGLTRVR